MSGTLISDPADEAALVALLRAGDETAFARLVDVHTPALLRVARTYVRSHEDRRRRGAGDLDRVDQGHRQVRGPIILAHLDFQR